MKINRIIYAKDIVPGIIFDTGGPYGDYINSIFILNWHKKDGPAVINIDVVGKVFYYLDNTIFSEDSYYMRISK